MWSPGGITCGSFWLLMLSGKVISLLTISPQPAEPWHPYQHWLSLPGFPCTLKLKCSPSLSCLPTPVGAQFHFKCTILCNHVSHQLILMRGKLKIFQPQGKSMQFWDRIPGSSCRPWKVHTSIIMPPSASWQRLTFGREEERWRLKRRQEGMGRILGLIHPAPLNHEWQASLGDASCQTSFKRYLYLLWQNHMYLKSFQISINKFQKLLN